MGNGMIGVTTARGMGPLPTVLERLAGTRAVERAFSRASVPVEVIDHVDHIVPMVHMVSVFEHAAREAGDRLFGLRVGMEMQPGAYGNWTRYGAEAETLGQAIGRLRKTILVNQNVGAMVLNMEGPYAVWTYLPQVRDKRLDQQHADHVVPVMIRFVQQYLGPKWRPAFVRVFYEDDQEASRLSSMVACDWRFGGKGISIAIDADRLNTPRPFDVFAPLSSVDLVSDVLAARTRSNLAEINALVATRLLAGETDIAGLAEFAGTSVRTIQRRLDRYGLTYRQVVDRMRHRKATALLLETNIPITDIAISLGYSDPAHFSRAFRRWSGRSPSAIRESA